MEKSEVVFDLESNPESRFQAIYEGLKFVIAIEKASTKPGMLSLVGAEAYCMLMDLKQSHAEQCENAESNAFIAPFLDRERLIKDVTERFEDPGFFDQDSQEAAAWIHGIYVDAFNQLLHS
jgi:hypothetical protein